MENNDFNNNEFASNGEHDGTFPDQNSHPEVENDGGASKSGLGSYLADVLRQEIEKRKRAQSKLDASWNKESSKDAPESENCQESTELTDESAGESQAAIDDGGLDGSAENCSEKGCSPLDFRPARPGEIERRDDARPSRPIDDSWGEDKPRNPWPKRSTEDGGPNRFSGPFPWDFV